MGNERLLFADGGRKVGGASAAGGMREMVQPLGDESAGTKLEMCVSESDAERILRKRLSAEDYARLARLGNAELNEFIARHIGICNPAKVIVGDGSPEDVALIREEAARNGEEIPLKRKGHTAHFDGYYDQGRAVKDTKILLRKGESLGAAVEAMDRGEGLAEMEGLMDGIMEGKVMHVRFHVLGPAGSKVGMPCVQITDSAYVAHTENLLYRQGYDAMGKLGPEAKFLKFVHSAGELDGNGMSKNVDKGKIYIDLAGETVYTANRQYVGNAGGLKKLALRLTIRRASEEGWLSEHMFLMGVNGPGGRRTYFSGAFPSMCGKTSTAMVRGGAVVGDDISYIWLDGKGKARAVNAERGMFGIITEVNGEDDPLIWKVLRGEGNEVVLSNVCMFGNGDAYWTSRSLTAPEKGRNFSGEWWQGKLGPDGKVVPPSHPNARFAVSLDAFENLDPAIDAPEGVPLRGIIFGGRDPDTSVPVREALDWEHGVIVMGAALESVRTAATIGNIGERNFDPMAIRDFLSIPLGTYVSDYLNFGKRAGEPPKIFAVNYFRADKDGKFLTGKRHKEVWLRWMELRVHGEAGAIEAPTGLIPKYGDLVPLFKEVLGIDYAQKDYDAQFTIRIPENLAKIERVTAAYLKEPGTPKAVFDVLWEQRGRLLDAQKEFGDYILPGKFE